MQNYTENTVNKQRIALSEQSERLYHDILKLLENTDNSNNLLVVMQKLLYAYARACQEPLVQLLYKYNVRQEEVGQALGISRAAVALKFPKKTSAKTNGRVVTKTQ